MINDRIGLHSVLFNTIINELCEVVLLTSSYCELGLPVVTGRIEVELSVKVVTWFLHIKWKKCTKCTTILPFFPLNKH